MTRPNKPCAYLPTPPLRTRTPCRRAGLGGPPRAHRLVPARRVRPTPGLRAGTQPAPTRRSGPFLNLDAHLSLRNWELKPGHVAPLRLVGTHLLVRHWALEGNPSSADFKRHRILLLSFVWASHRYLLLDERTEYFEWLCTVRSRCFGLPPGLVSLGGNSAFLSGHEAGSVVGYLCVKWVRMLVKSPQSCAFGFAMVPTLMVLTPLVNSPR